MKKYLILCLLVSPLLLLSFVFPENKPATNNPTPITDSSYDLLEAYGKYIYQREKCDRCHTYIPVLDSTKISLENIAGKYPDSWHYQHLDDPRIVMPGSTMPRFKKLSKNPLSYKPILDLLNEGYSSITEADSMQLRIDLENEAKGYLLSLKKDEIFPQDPVYNETIALIAWLQYRPDTPEQRYTDSLKNDKNRRYEEQIMATLKSDLSDPESRILKLANSKDPAILEKGWLYFSRSCATCHRENGGGSIGPNLTDDFWIHGNSTRALFLTIYNGVNAMPAWKHTLDKESIAAIVAYTRFLKGSKPVNAKEPQGIRTN